MTNTYDVPAEILIRLNEGQNPTQLSAFTIRAKEGGQGFDDEGRKFHSVSGADISYGLLLALRNRIQGGNRYEKDYITEALHGLIKEAQK